MRDMKYERKTSYWVRGLCLVLAALMVLGMGYTALYFLLLA